ncbi:hypothetical protein B0G81_3960 [Paraburkholderia sp. BL6665CI2N2]|uniref:hypothetical protein n=1 Tax=Paraburkholderia sp. BL6665CI2N2 TaxID=1938806 RepID=UPI00106604E4|nr:hypothetical protein [Paraburkholderia sp. BL6665CI2N2]TDY23578.1 hypothetical protein B0G81_3960 [Paraburkholderia sp. BL6665CI2N2]
MAEPKAELTAVAKAIDPMTRQRATEHAQKAREKDAHARTARTTPNAYQGRDKRGRFVGGVVRAVQAAAPMARAAGFLGVRAARASLRG